MINGTLNNGLLDKDVIELTARLNILLKLYFVSPFSRLGLTKVTVPTLNPTNGI